MLKCLKNKVSPYDYKKYKPHPQNNNTKIMVTFIDNIIYLPTDKHDDLENTNRNKKIFERINNLKKKYENIVPQNLDTRFILEGRVRRDASLDEFTINPIENVSDALWEKLQYVYL